MPRATFRPLERAVRTLHQRDEPALAQRIQQVLADAGWPRRALDSLGEELADIPVSRSKAGRDRALQQVADLCARVAGRAAEALAAEGTPAATRARLAEALLALDSEAAPLWQMLGGVEHQGRWLDRERSALVEREQQIARALVRARDLDVAIEHRSGDDHPLLRELPGGPVHTVSAHGVTLSSRLHPKRLERVLRRVLQGCALSGWLRGAELRVPDGLSLDAVLLRDRPAYLAAIDLDLERGRIDAQRHALFRPITGYFTDAGRLAQYHFSDANGAAALLTHVLGVSGDHLLGEKEQAWLLAGHTSWICGQHLLAPFPQLLTHQPDEPRTATALERARLEREGALRGAGMRGGVAFVRELTRRNGDPKIPSLLRRERIAQLRPEEVSKAMTVVDYLQRTDPLRIGRVLAATAAGDPDPRSSLEQALGEDLAALETTWRTWILGTPKGVRQELEQGLRSRNSTVLAALSDARSRAFRSAPLKRLPDPWLEPELSRGAQLHVDYLLRNRAQANRWPDAHEQRPERPGFTPDGAWAARNSVIATGMRDPERVLSGWMATYYHRLPLLDPGLLAIGWAQEEGVSVLDCLSMVRDLGRPWTVTWPWDGMTDVPLRGASEEPPPAPGRDLSQMGYPITLQVRVDSLSGRAPRFRMSLRVDRPDGEIVPSLQSDPYTPLNDRLIPNNAFCLLPEAPLEPDREYFVEALDPEAGARVTWRFRTRDQ